MTVDLDHLEALAKEMEHAAVSPNRGRNVDWSLIDRGSAAILALIAEVRALRDVCAAAYQLAGTMNAPVRFLDALSDASNGEIEARAKTDDLLPVSPDEVGSFLSDEGQEYREDAERYRFARESIQEGYVLPGGFYLSESGGESWDKTIDAARREKA